MSDVQYKVAKTVREAAGMMLAAKGKGYILAGGTDLLVQMKSGARTPGVIVDVKKIPEMVSVVRKERRLHHRRRDAGRRAGRAQEAAQGLARA